MTPIKPPGVANVPDLPDLTDQIRMLVAVHVERDGMCEGCLNTWARLAPHPCRWAQWAHAWLAEPTSGTSPQP
ncbi:hypothetical protein AB0K00_42455 [Dactylosporangium sp. NPDC049525]|uniref:hypothetical protein n=1 Tax=Dactylosporangium sp. NPDC049525 TaxID=3154730 RepID=UPI003446C33A